MSPRAEEFPESLFDKLRVVLWDQDRSDRVLWMSPEEEDMLFIQQATASINSKCNRETRREAVKNTSNSL